MREDISAGKDYPKMVSVSERSVDKSGNRSESLSLLIPTEPRQDTKVDDEIVEDDRFNVEFDTLKGS